MRRILQINSVFGTGSTGRIALALQTAAERAGMDAWVAYGRGPAHAHAKTIRIGGTTSVLSHVALTRLFDGHGLGSRSATRSLLKAIESARPDVVHLHNIHGYYLNFELLFAHLRSSRIPVIWTLHDCWPFTGHCAHYEFAECQKWQVFCSKCPQSRRYPASWALDRSYANFDRKRASFAGLERMTLVTPSRWLADELRRSFLASYPIEVIPNGIDLQAFAPTYPDGIRSRYGIGPDSRVVLAVAADFSDPRKGLRYLLGLSPLLPKDVTIVVVGVPATSTRGFPSNMFAVPRTADTLELAALYSLASVFVNPTLEDTFPTVNLEALACGLPIVAFSTGGCPEQICDGTGLVVPKGDLQALAAAVGDILAGDRQTFASACVANAAQYSTEAMAREYIRLYLSAIG
jgi:glycosyltransferase involved in cell wall biosynthesis